MSFVCLLVDVLAIIRISFFIYELFSFSLFYPQVWRSFLFHLFDYYDSCLPLSLFLRYFLFLSFPFFDAFIFVLSFMFCIPFFSFAFHFSFRIYSFWVNFFYCFISCLFHNYSTIGFKFFITKFILALFLSPLSFTVFSPIHLYNFFSSLLLLDSHFFVLFFPLQLFLKNLIYIAPYTI